MHNRSSNFEFIYADGGEVSASEYGALSDVLGNTYGTASQPDSVVLPDLSDRVAMGDGIGPMLGVKSGSNETYLQPVNMPSSVFDGAPYNNRQAGLSLRYLICTDGVYSAPSGTPPPGDLTEGILGQIMLYADDGPIPEGWMLADGSLLPVSGNQLLFSVLGVNYGGNGNTNFAVPDLVNYIPIGSGGDFYSGQKFGTPFTALTPDQVPEPGVCALVCLGLAGMFAVRRRRVER